MRRNLVEGQRAVDLQPLLAEGNRRVQPGCEIASRDDAVEFRG